MNRYRITSGVTEVGPGQIVQLDRKQYDRRAHRVDVIKETKDSVTIKTRDVMQFKVGEEIGLPELPKHMVDMVEPLSKPKTEADRVAKSKSAARKGSKGNKAARTRKRTKDTKVEASPNNEDPPDTPEATVEDDQIEVRSESDRRAAIADVKADRSASSFG